jgi:hypothetical protein
MRHLHLLKFLFIIFAVFVSSAHAVIIEGDFWGTAKEQLGAEDSPADNFEVVAAGTKVSGAFWYDTEKAQKYQSSTPTNDNRFYSQTDEWTGTSFSVNGKTYLLSDGVQNPFQVHFGSRYIWFRSILRSMARAENGFIWQTYTLIMKILT